MPTYQRLVDDDPEGFVEVRRRLETWFPKLSHVATSAMGASIGPHIADFVVTPQAITYVASDQKHKCLCERCVLNACTSLPFTGVPFWQAAEWSRTHSVRASSSRGTRVSAYV